MPRYSITIAKEIDIRLEQIALKNGITKGEALKRAFALLAIADKVESMGNTLGIVNQDPDTGNYSVIGMITG